MCKYCSDKKPLVNVLSPSINLKIYIEPAYKDEFYKDEDEPAQMIIDDGSAGQIAIELEYCPRCGQDLRI